MSYDANLLAIDPIDLAAMEACYRPLGFATRKYDTPITSAELRAWLASCGPLVQQLGTRASALVAVRYSVLREQAEKPGTDRQTHDALTVYHFFQQLAAEFLDQGAGKIATAKVSVFQEVEWQRCQSLHLDRKPLVPGPSRSFPEDRAFASAPITHSPFERLYIWRSASEVRELVNGERGPLFTPRPELELLRRDWSTLLELLRAAASARAAFLSWSVNTTDYE